MLCLALMVLDSELVTTAVWPECGQCLADQQDSFLKNSVVSAPAMDLSSYYYSVMQRCEYLGVSQGLTLSPRW